MKENGSDTEEMRFGLTLMSSLLIISFISICGAYHTFKGVVYATHSNVDKPVFNRKDE